MKFSYSILVLEEDIDLTFENKTHPVKKQINFQFYCRHIRYSYLHEIHCTYSVELTLSLAVCDSPDNDLVRGGLAGTRGAAGGADTLKKGG